MFKLKIRMPEESNYSIKNNINRIQFRPKIINILVDQINKRIKIISRKIQIIYQLLILIKFITKINSYKNQLKINRNKIKILKINKFKKIRKNQIWRNILNSKMI